MIRWAPIGKSNLASALAREDGGPVFQARLRASNRPPTFRTFSRFFLVARLRAGAAGWVGRGCAKTPGGALAIILSSRWRSACKRPIWGARAPITSSQRTPAPSVAARARWRARPAPTVTARDNWRAANVFRSRFRRAWILARVFAWRARVNQA